MSKQQKGLGKGLDAIFQTNIPHINAPAKYNDRSINELSITQIEPNPDQPRTFFDDDAIEELAQSIRRLGIIQPITVRESNNGIYLIISGERRFRACQIAGLKSIPAYIRKANDQEILEMALVENIQREQLNAIEIALTFNRLLKECNLTQVELSERVGKKRSTIANYVRLLTLPSEVQISLREDLISMGHARALAALEQTIDQLYILEQIIENKLSVRETEDLTSKINQTQTNSSNKVSKTSNNTDRNNYKVISNKLSNILGTKVNVTKNSKGEGVIAIKFSTEEQLQFLKDILSSKNSKNN